MPYPPQRVAARADRCRRHDPRDVVGVVPGGRCQRGSRRHGGPHGGEEPPCARRVEEQQRLPDPCASSPGPAWSGPRWRPRVRHHEGAVDNAGRQVDRAARCQVLGPCLQEVPHDASLDPTAAPSAAGRGGGKARGQGTAHAAPVRRPPRTPLRPARSSWVIDRPRPSARRVGAGIKGASSAPWASVRASRRARRRHEHGHGHGNRAMYEMTCNKSDPCNPCSPSGQTSAATFVARITPKLAGIGNRYDLLDARALLSLREVPALF
jgi:hypothetical protein